MRLYVNIDHVATLREARRTDEPDPARAAAAAERAGADGITVHLREDRRHIQDADVTALTRSVRTVLNLELGAHAEIVRCATRSRDCSPRGFGSVSSSIHLRARSISRRNSASRRLSCTPAATPTLGDAEPKRSTSCGGPLPMARA